MNQFEFNYKLTFNCHFQFRMQNVGKKATRGKKGKKLIKQSGNKFGLDVNLDEEQPQIPQQNKQEEEEGFKVIQVVHVQVERDEPPHQQKQEPTIEPKVEQLHKNDLIVQIQAQKNANIQEIYGSISYNEQKISQQEKLILDTCSSPINHKNYIQVDSLQQKKQILNDQYQYYEVKEKEIQKQEVKNQYFEQQKKSDDKNENNLNLNLTFVDKKIKKDAPKVKKKCTNKPKPKSNISSFTVNAQFEQDIAKSEQIHIPIAPATEQIKQNSDKMHKQQEIILSTKYIQNQVLSTEKDQTSVQQKINTKKEQYQQEKDIVQLDGCFKIKRKQDVPQVQQQDLNNLQSQEIQRQKKQLQAKKNQQDAQIEITPLQLSVKKPTAKKGKNPKKKENKSKKAANLNEASLMQQFVLEEEESSIINSKQQAEVINNFKPFLQNHDFSSEKQKSIEQYRQIEVQSQNFSNQYEQMNVKIEQPERVKEDKLIKQQQEIKTEERLLISQQLQDDITSEIVEEKRIAIEQDKLMEKQHLKLQTISFVSTKKNNIPKKSTKKEKKKTVKQAVQFELKSTLEQISPKKQAQTVDINQQKELVKNNNFEKVQQDDKIQIQEKKNIFQRVENQKETQINSIVVQASDQVQEEDKFEQKQVQIAKLKQQSLQTQLIISPEQQQSQIQILTPVLTMNIVSNKKLSKKGPSVNKSKVKTKVNQSKIKQLQFQVEQSNNKQPQIIEKQRVNKEQQQVFQKVTMECQNRNQVMQESIQLNNEFIVKNQTSKIQKVAIQESIKNAQNQKFIEQQQSGPIVINYNTLISQSINVQFIDPFIPNTEQKTHVSEIKEQEVQDVAFIQDLVKTKTKSNKKNTKKGNYNKKQKTTIQLNPTTFKVHIEEETEQNKLIEQVSQAKFNNRLQIDQPTQNKQIKQINITNFIHNSFDEQSEHINIQNQQNQQISNQIYEQKKQYPKFSDQPLASVKEPVVKKNAILSEIVELIRFKGSEQIRINKERLNMLEEDIRSRLLKKIEVKNIGVGYEDKTMNRRNHSIYSRIIDQNIALREQLRTGQAEF